MAINSITFGGVNSADYGIYISGEGVFDAPKREVEMVSIPGRNGDLCIDHGRFENIEVTYPAFNYEAEYDDFVQNLADFRNAISSQKGYQRLSDTFHPDEYRMATFIDGLEIEPIKYNTASEFNIVFNCKPQRYLTSGETSVSVTSGDTLTNPTRFESSPLLEIEGHGGIQFGGYEVNIEDTTIGHVSLVDASQGEMKGINRTLDFPMNNLSLINIGDEVAIGENRLTLTLKYLIAIRSVSVTDSNPVFTSTATVDAGSPTYVTVETVLPPSTTAYEGSGAILHKYETVTITAVNSHNETITSTLTYDLNTLEQSSNPCLNIYRSDLTTSGGTVYDYLGVVCHTDGISAESTKTIIGDTPIFIDCDLGTAYKIEGGEVIDLNSYIDLGSDLPILASGANTITFDNTITDLKVIPRWWKI